MIKKINLNLEILLYPFRKLDYYNEDQFLKMAIGSGCYKENQQAFLKNIWKDINQYAQIHSLDEIRMILEMYYPFLLDSCKYSEEDVYQKYDSIINQLSQSLITHRDGRIVFKYWENKIDKELFGPCSTYLKIHIFQRINQMIPLDLIVCNYLLEKNMNDVLQLHGYFSHIVLADKQLQDVLEKGVGENHLHFGAAEEFTILWTDCMNCFCRNDRSSLVNINKLSATYGTKKGSYVLYACINRIFLATFLCTRIDYKTNDSFEKWIEDFKYDEVLKKLIHGFSIETQDNGNGIEELQFERYERYWNEILQKNGKAFLGNDLDYITELFPASRGIHTYGENVFLFQALKYHKENANDTLFFKLFLSYIRVKNDFFTEISQQKALVGLDYFQEYYSAVKKVSKNKISIEERYKHTFRSLFHNTQLKKIEIRLGPDNPRKRLIGILKAYKEVIDDGLESSKKYEFPLLGITYHFLKKEDRDWGGKCWINQRENKDREEDYIWYGAIQKQYKEQLEEILELRNEIPYLSNFIIGLDAASNENNTPVCVFSPIFNLARDGESQTVISRTKNGLLVKNRSLSFTFHAGEDFRHMLSGLRRIDEVIDHCHFYVGDRIGHGIVLGLNPEQWAKQNSIVTLPVGEYLEDLLWVWGNINESQELDTSLLLYLEKKIYEFAEKILKVMNGVTAQLLYKVYLSRFELMKKDKFEMTYDVMKKLEPGHQLFCYKAKDVEMQSWTFEKLALSIHCSCYLNEFCKPIQISVTERDIKIVKLMQSIVLDKISANGIIVEMNPTSNVMIGEMDSVFGHQVYKLNPVERDAIHSIMVNVNSDDPTVFNTNVSNELAYLYYGLLERKIGKEESLRWIDRIRQYGMDTSFVKDMDREAYYENLKSVLEDLGQEV